MPTNTNKTKYILAGIFFILYALVNISDNITAYFSSLITRLCWLLSMVGMLVLGISLFRKKLGRFTLVISAVLAVLRILSFSFSFLTYGFSLTLFGLLGGFMGIVGFVFLPIALGLREDRVWFVPFLFTALSEFFSVCSWLFSFLRYFRFMSYTSFGRDFLLSFLTSLVGSIFICLAMLFLSLCLKTDPTMDRGKFQNPYNGQ